MATLRVIAVVMCFRACMRVYQYMEKLSGGKTVVRSEAGESRAARQHELQCQHHVDALLDKLHREMDTESTGMVLPQITVVHYGCGPNNFVNSC